MESLFTSEYRYIWTVVMTIALFFPVRRLIWVLTVRRAVKKGGEENVDEAEKVRLRRRAAITAGLICFIFSLGYTKVLFAS